MRKLISQLIFASLGLISLPALAVTRYVDLNSLTPAPPYTTWTTAATNIQSAVDVAAAGDLVLVTNGVYFTGSRLTSDGIQNRVVITNPIVLRSFNGPTVTTIDGGNLVRGAYLTNGAMLDGLTITKGKGGNGGGVFCASTSEVLTNCSITSNLGVSGGGVFAGTLFNCNVSGNTSGSATVNRGGGAYGSVLNNCIISGNKGGNGSGNDGGGAFGCILNFCTISGNSVGTVYGSGGGACSSTLTSCTVYGNSAGWGGGVAYSTLSRCSLFSNTATEGGGVANSTVYNSLVATNTASGGGGSYWSTLINCQVVGNASYALGGAGADRGSLVNCVVFGNTSSSVGGVSDCGVVNSIIVNNVAIWGDDNYDVYVRLNYSCTTPIPPNGVGNISSDPLFVNASVGDYRLQTNSPCVEAGNNAYVSMTNDYAGNARIIGADVDMGAFEFQFPTYFSIQPQSQTVFGEYPVSFSALAVSPLPFKYQWQFNGTNIAGATNASYAINFTQQTNAGIYRVVVSNALLTVNSSNALLTIDFPLPTLVSQPTNLIAILTSNASFSVAASNLYPIKFQWQRNGTNLSNSAKLSGVTNSTLTVSNLQFSDGALYQVIVSNKYNSVTSSPALLTILGGPNILETFTNTVAFAHTAKSLSVIVTGAPPISFRWQKNNTNLTNGPVISGADTPTLTLLDPLTPDSGNYRVIVSNRFGTVTSTNARLTVVPFLSWGFAAKTPPFTATNVIAMAAGTDGGDFDAVLRGDGTVIQWGMNANIPPEATNLTMIDAGGQYIMGLRKDRRVVVWGDTNLNVWAGTPIPATVTNVVSIASGISHFLALRGDGNVIGWGDNGYGQATPPVSATNLVAIAAGENFSLGLRQDGTVIGLGANVNGETSPPQTATNLVALAAGRNHSLGLRSDGSILGWGVNYFGQASPPANATNVTMISAGLLTSLALRGDGSVTEWGGNLGAPQVTDAVAISYRDYHGLVQVRDPLTRVAPTIFGTLFDRAVSQGQTTIFHPGVTGSRPFSYKWFFNGNPIPNQTNAWLALSGMQPSQAGNYHFVVTNAYGAATGQVATVAVLPWATIATQPTNQSVVLGSNVTFTVATYGQPPFHYQWMYEGAPLVENAQVAGVTSGTLQISGVQVSNAGAYSVAISNALNVTTSQVATLTVLIPAAITSDLTNQNVLAGSNVVFSVAASGDAPLIYEWRKNGAWLPDGGRVSGASTATLVVSGVLTNDTGDYQVIVANSYGTSTSSVARLEIYNPAQIIAPPESTAALVGSNAQFRVTATGSALGYQWFHDGVPLLDDVRISGSHASVLNIANVQSFDSGGYHVVVSNILSATTSSMAVMTALNGTNASIRYVNLGNPTPAPPYLDWPTAATTIQDAIDASVAGDLILVTNGLYQSGGRVASGLLTNRVAVNKAVTVQSVNGPAVTFIHGSRGLGTNAVRCVYLTNSAALVGFTLTNGATRNTGDVIKDQSGGGVWCEATNSRILNCLIISNSAAQYGGGLYSGSSSNCAVIFNSATYGGGVFGGIVFDTLIATNSAANGAGASSNRLNNCQLLANKGAGFGAGAYGSFLVGSVIAWNTNSGQGAGLHSCVATTCMISNNVSTANWGGGAYGGSLTNCTVIHNSATRGGGVYSAIVYDSPIQGNVATDSTGGGGAAQSTLFNCLVKENRAVAGTGGGGYVCTFNNSLIVSNVAAGAGVGAYGGTLLNSSVVGHTNGSGVYLSTLRNSIVYYNAVNYSGGSMLNCCSTPLPAGTGNFTNAPRFLNLEAGNYRLQSNSPCINAGINAYMTNIFDLDGAPRLLLGTVDVGAYEFQGQAGSSSISYLWLQQFGLPLDSSADLMDADGDGMNNWNEWKADTNPTNAASTFQIISATKTLSGPRVVWQSVPTRTYWIERATNLASPSSFQTIATNIPGAAVTRTYTDTGAINSVPYFYRVGVR